MRTLLKTIALGIAAMIFVGLTTLRAIFGQLNPRHVDSVSAAALYWYSVVLMSGLIWYVIFITK